MIPVGPIRSAVLDWYRVHGRPLAFRRTSDPWAILVSEVMAQQTQAARAAEAWVGFMAAFPTPASFAAASPAAALRAWRGLGYNRRALALQRAAGLIVHEHGGRLPDDLEALERLPGVGPYTARAVAALAFGRRVGAVDTNVRRVLTRALFAGSPTPAAIQAAADALAPRSKAGEWTHAVMDVGATFCRPRRPICGECPARPSCRYGRASESSAGGPAASLAAPRAAARPAPRAAAPRAPAAATPFEATTRWLRGRILDRLRDVPDHEWVAFDEPIGDHPLASVAAALARMAVEGLVEVHGAGPESRLPLEARLPLA